MRRINSLYASLLLAVLISGCEEIFGVKERVVGNWQIVAFSVNGMQRGGLGARDPGIDFRSDFTGNIRSSDFNQLKPNFYSFKWRFANHKHQVILTPLDSISGNSVFPSDLGKEFILQIQSLYSRRKKTRFALIENQIDSIYSYQFVPYEDL